MSDKKRYREIHQRIAGYKPRLRIGAVGWWTPTHEEREKNENADQIKEYLKGLEEFETGCVSRYLE